MEPRETYLGICEDCIFCQGSGGWCTKLDGKVYLDDDICKHFKKELNYERNSK